ncbi:hypothetical protein PGT21_010336 [Puccinia graminis f. sp. tritici]|uniref:Uncharacterized protein n=1 Tax=Puccinia graminis f. sp. tritici TaxID=56615 RepID=A0A5B0NFZ2_PUCGR|nr:hypothetical protein PGT21_010051 [Puccinia graminis f. sp. tritici]KAA1086739.1 hypothetical protein PGT21_010336 [Puccinia graminis f. sp. tritici]KAA1090027.1 hypothetical protein PGTUg99_034190 [Puccinia graminis f. sp. tritici]KAA1129180.1 hypothetical protein PGTUg99_003778 [Puccinia graminis f. sp. tritici]
MRPLNSIKIFLLFLSVLHSINNIISSIPETKTQDMLDFFNDLSILTEPNDENICPRCGTTKCTHPNCNGSKN